MALTPEQARAFYEQAIEAGYSDDEIVAELKARSSSGAPAAPVVAPESSTGDDVFNYLNTEVQAETPGAPETLQGLARGIRRGSLGMVQGARKLYNQATGDDAAVGRINQQNALMQAQQEERDPTGSGMSAEDVGNLLALMGTGGAAGAGAKGYLGAAGVGGVGGVLQPTTKDQSQLGNLGAGMAGGVAGQAVGQATGGIVNALRRTDAGTALEDFTRKAMGVDRGTQTDPLYKGITDSVEAQRGRLGEEFSKRYSNIEGAASGGVTLPSTSRLSDEALTLPEEVMNALSPGAQRVMNALSRGATHTSPIVDTGGKAIQLPKSVEFSEVRDTVRALRKAKRAMPYTDAGQMRGQQIGNLIERLDDDLTNWGRASEGIMGPANRDVLAGARKADVDFKEQVAPFDNKDEVIGQLRRGVGDEGAVNRSFMGNDKGQAVAELLSRVPESRADARALYGTKLLTDRGETSAMRQLEGGTTAENLLTPEERAYTKLLAENLRENKGSGGIDAGRLLRSLLHAPVVESLGGRKMDRALTGVLRYGQRPVDTSTLQQLLRAYGGAQASGE